MTEDQSVLTRPQSVAERFAQLFAGLQSAHGVYNNLAEADTQGKKVGTERRTVRGPVTVDLYERHLKGESGLGICPIRSDSSVLFGAVDIDVYAELNHAVLAGEIGKLPLVVCRSKSGGAHVYCFTSEPVAAALMVSKLKEIAAMLGHGNAEIFPKQIVMQPDENGQECGSWINLPYFNGVMAARFAVQPDGIAMDLTEFLDEAEKLRTPLTWFEHPITKNTRPVQSILDEVISQLKNGSHAGRDNAGYAFFRRLRVEGYNKAQCDQVIHEWVQTVNVADPKDDAYTAADARRNLGSAFRKPLAEEEKNQRCRTRDPREPWKQPENGSGLVQEIEKAIRTDHHFARDEGDLLYHFEEGVYKPKGEKFIRRAVKEYCEKHGKTKSWSPELADKVAKYMTVDAPELWDRPRLDVLNVRNGLLEVSTRALGPHSPDFLSPVQIEASYDSSAKCPAIERFITDVFPEDARHIPYEIAAWLMLADTSIQKAVLAVGEGSNGKSVFLTLLEDFLGKENICSVALHKIEADKFAAARLCGKLANICADLPTAALSGTSMFKALTGGDFINAERKYQASFEFRPYARLVFSANTLPRSDDATHGFFRRWLVIPFTRTFDEKDPGWVPHPVLKARLQAELPGLLNRALDALAQVRTGAFRESQSLKQAWDQFRQTTDPLAVFLDANTVENPASYLPKLKLRELYTADCRDNGRPLLPEAVFTERLRRLRPRVTTGQRTAKKTWCFVGIGLRTDEEPPHFEQFTL